MENIGTKIHNNILDELWDDTYYNIRWNILDNSIDDANINVRDILWHRTMNNIRRNINFMKIYSATKSIIKSNIKNILNE